MNFRPLIAALTASILFACGPQNIVEDNGGVPESEIGVSHDEARSTSGGGKAPAQIAMKVQTSASLGGAFATTYSINATRDLFFALDVPSTKSGSHLARFEVVAPNGAVYQVLETPFAAGTAPVGAEVSADIIGGGYRVWASLPVAATFIQQMAMTGRWTVKAFLDNVQVASSTFTLNT